MEEKEELKKIASLMRETAELLEKVIECEDEDEELLARFLGKLMLMQQAISVL